MPVIRDETVLREMQAEQVREQSRPQSGSTSRSSTSRTNTGRGSPQGLSNPLLDDLPSLPALQELDLSDNTAAPVPGSEPQALQHSGEDTIFEAETVLELPSYNPLID